MKTAKATIAKATKQFKAKKGKTPVQLVAATAEPAKVPAKNGGSQTVIKVKKFTADKWMTRISGMGGTINSMISSGKHTVQDIKAALVSKHDRDLDKAANKLAAHVQWVNAGKNVLRNPESPRVHVKMDAKGVLSFSAGPVNPVTNKAE